MNWIKLCYKEKKFKENLTVKYSLIKLSQKKFVQPAEKGKKINQKDPQKEAQRVNSYRTMDYLQKNKPHWRFNLPFTQEYNEESQKQIT
ncbi:hypothetical protein KQX54_000572 [Cotesia glomerata]|uniref:Uncharacterized protein n=1 Tax=Cotesia glomerata TaxID=32391 RepID=A0AAV7HW79_COTGL|nr:hypothetical protein KQX54_000572 [Cotesia glomerata]